MGSEFVLYLDLPLKYSSELLDFVCHCFPQSLSELDSESAACLQALLGSVVRVLSHEILNELELIVCECVLERRGALLVDRLVIVLQSES